MEDKVNYTSYFKIKHIFSFSSLNYLQAGLSFFASIILARYLGAEMYGIFTYGLVFANTLMVIMQFGTDKTLVRDLIQEKTPNKTVSVVAFIWSIIGFVGIIGILIWGFFISEINNLTAWIVLLCTLGGVAQGLTVGGWFDFAGKMTLHAFFGALSRIIYFLGIVIVVFLIKEKNNLLVTAATLLFLSRLLTLCLEWKYMLRHIKILFHDLQEKLIKILKTNSWIWFASIGNLLMTQANQIILKDIEGTQQLAYYGIAFQIILVIKLLQNQIIRIVAPSIANKTSLENFNKSIVIKSLFQYSLVSFFATMLLLIPLYFFTPWIVKILLGEEFLPAIPVMYILYIWIAIYGVALINNQYLVNLRKEATFFRITIIFGIISLILSYFFIQKYGVVGAALSLLIAHFCSIISQFTVVLIEVNKNEKSL